MDKEYLILEHIQNNPQVNQRDLAHVAQASLGMVNAILKRFAEKGLITIKKVNNRNIRYVLTSEGCQVLGERSWGYFKRTIKNVVVYRKALAEIIMKAKAEGYEGIVLSGGSDLDFIIEHECYKQGMPYLELEDEDRRDGEALPVRNLPGQNLRWFEFIPENYSIQSASPEPDNGFALSRLVMR